MNLSSITGRHLPGLLMVVALFLFLTPPTAHAHAKLLRSQPEARAALKEPPKAVELWFSEELEVEFSTVIVTDTGGRRVDKGSVRLAEGGKKLEAELEDLPAGTYTVDWKALSTDQHMMKGKFTFTVEAARRAAAQADTSSAGKMKSGEPSVGQSPRMPEGMKESSTEGPVSSWGMEIARWFEYLAMMLLFGGFMFHQLILKPSFGVMSGDDKVGKSASMTSAIRRIALLSWLSIAMLAVTSVMSLVLQTAVVNEKSIGEALRPSLLSQVITASGFGAAWRLEVWAIIALAIILFYLVRVPRLNTSATHSLLWWTALAVSAVLFVVPSWTGHAAAAEKEYRFALAADWLHLVAAAFWVGGLFHLALTLPVAVSGLVRRQRLGVIYKAIHLFTRLALISVAVIVLTGLYNSWIHVESFRALWQTPYGKTLLLKVLLVLPMLALGGLNTFVIHPRLKRELETDESAVEGETSNLDRSFYRSVALEALLGALVLLVAAVLVFLQPGREHPVQMTEMDERASYLNLGD